MIWTAENIRAASKLWAEGKTCKEIAAVFGSTQPAVRSLTRRNPECFPKREKTLSKREVANLKNIKIASKLWAEGKTYSEIGAHLGVTKKVISGIANRNRDKFPKRGKTITVKKEKPVKIEQPPKEIPLPDDVKVIPWNELRMNQCQWSLGGFWEKPSNTFKCCGKDTIGRNRFCEFHNHYRKEGWDR